MSRHQEEKIRRALRTRADDAHITVSHHLKQVRSQLRHNLLSCYQGWWKWRSVLKNTRAGKRTAVILLPSCQRDINYLALLYLDAMLTSRHYQNAVILTHDTAVMKCAGLFSKNILRILPFSRQDAECLMQLYCLYAFDERFIVASFDEPNGRNGSALVGKRGTTVEELFVIGIYRLYPLVRPNPPKYAGTDSEINAFLNA